MNGLAVWWYRLVRLPTAVRQQGPAAST